MQLINKAIITLSVLNLAVQVCIPHLDKHMYGNPLKLPKTAFFDNRISESRFCHWVSSGGRLILLSAAFLTIVLLGQP